MQEVVGEQIGRVCEWVSECWCVQGGGEDLCFNTPTYTRANANAGLRSDDVDGV